jgi:two-component system cell cycle response regulator
MSGDQPTAVRSILLVDDDGVSRSVLAKMLSSRGYTVLEAESGGQALKLFARPEAPRMAVVDWNMGSINGPELCRILRGRSPYVYVVLTTAREGRRPLIEAMNSGADGYMQKPIDADELEAWLVAGQRIVTLQDRLLRAQEELERRATQDSLTGLRNRASLLDQLQKEFSRGARTKVPVGVVTLDVDHFKRINDTYGHPVGDEVLIEVGKRCASTVRDYDGFGRFGGEEFLAIVPGGGSVEVEIVASRLLTLISRAPFSTSAGEISVTVSAGAASTAHGYASQSSLLAAADAALYRAKEAGRGCYKLAEVLPALPGSEFPSSEPDTLKA